MKEKVLKAMREYGQPVNAGKIAEITGIDRKEVDKAFAELKKEGAIVSPVRCKWEPAKWFRNATEPHRRKVIFVNFVAVCFSWSEILLYRQRNEE